MSVPTARQPPARAPRAAPSIGAPRGKHPPQRQSGGLAAPRPDRARGCRGAAGPGRRCPSCQALRSPAPGEAGAGWVAVIAARGSPDTRPSFLLSFLPSLPVSAPGPGPAVTVTAPSPAPPAAHPPLGSRDRRSADAAAAPGARGGRRRGDAMAAGGAVTAGCAGPRVRGPARLRYGAVASGVAGAAGASGPGPFLINLGLIRELV